MPEGELKAMLSTRAALFSSLPPSSPPSSSDEDDEWNTLTQKVNLKGPLGWLPARHDAKRGVACSESQRAVRNPPVWRGLKASGSTR